ncbi:oligosaccharide flippase family protein [Mucilaginibacter sp. FT3.2]|uniref:oligosaccharide flippase family protein n=1 Tax=Mucilaginibacter sp. FT3.2 TaxID=2723090 RepID=UPI00160D5D54|nr:oligosaccharide flippase family protein [Mucilaginibacter sp. FT3.2]MBB6233635.1 O-antigen/teichoic acid export membrane protein [Mucilaginibacter sp. FT3.2]
MIKKILRSNTSWSLISNGITALLGFLNLGLIAHQFSKEDAGKWFMLLTVYTLFELLRSGWVQTPFVRYYVVASGKEDQAKLTGASWQLLLMFTLIITLVLFCVFTFIKIDNTAFSLAKKFAVLWLFSALPYQLLQWQLQARSLFKKLSLIRMLFPIAFTVLLLVQLKMHFAIETVVLLYALLQFLAGFVGVFLGWLHFGKWRTNLSAERKLLSNFGKYSMITMVTASLLRSSDQFIIAFWLGPAAVAVYSIPQKLIEAIEIPVRSFASIAIPKATSLFQERKIDELRRFFYNQCGLLTAIILPLLIVLFVFPSPIVHLLGGGKYSESSILLQIFCFYAALIPLDRYCGLLLDAGNRPRINTLKVIAMLIINVALDIAALWLGLGLYGVAAGSTITFLVGIIIGWIQLKDILAAFKMNLFWKEGVQKTIISLRNHS